MRRSTLALVALGVVLALVVWFVFLINPKRGDISDIDDRISQTQAQAQGIRGEIAALKDIRDSELTFRRAIAEVENSIPRTPELAAFIEEVNLLAIDTDVEILNLTPSPPSALVDGQLFQALNVAINAQGQFFEILGFLYGLQDLERLVKIDSLSLTTFTTADGNREVTTAISGSIFTLATNLPTPSAEPPPQPEDASATTTTTVVEENAAGTADDGADTAGAADATGTADDGADT